MNKIRYTIATINDIATMADMRIQFLTELVGEQPNAAVEILRLSLKEAFAETMQNGTYIGWLAKNNDLVIATGGMIIIKRPGSFKNLQGVTGYIMNMFTLPQYRRQGISTELLNRLISSGHERGVSAFELHATKNGEPVYIKEGFHMHHEPTYRRYDNPY